MYFKVQTNFLHIEIRPQGFTVTFALDFKIRKLATMSNSNGGEMNLTKVDPGLVMKLKMMTCKIARKIRVKIIGGSEIGIFSSRQFFLKLPISTFLYIAIGKLHFIAVII